MAVTKSDLDQLVTILRNRSGREYTLDRMMGKYRLMRPDGRYGSPRLAAGAMKTYLDGFIEGVTDQQENTPVYPRAYGGPAMG